MTTTSTSEVRNRTVCGNLTRDPRLGFSNKGTPWCTCGLAVNHRRRLDNGTWEDGETELFELRAFGELAEHLAELSKGTRVIAYGHIEDETWTSKDGKERTTTKLIADDVGPSLRFATVEVHRVRRQEAPQRPAATADDYDYEKETY